MQEHKSKARVLIAPLDWGLGHASRDIQIITNLIEKGYDIIVATDKLPLNLLKKEFPDLKFIHFPSYTVKYSKKYLIFKLFIQIPNIIKGLIREHFVLKKIIKKYNIDLVVSDNRYGLWNKNVKTIFITHQIMIKLPKCLKIFEYPLYKLNKLAIEKFDECWIPDFQSENNLSGDLTHKFRPPANARFIGILSRFNTKKSSYLKKSTFKYDFLTIISGPEPHRSILEKTLLKQLNDSQKKCLLVRGLPGKNKTDNINENLEIISHLSTKDMAKAILNSEIIICRSGYTSIMDLIILNKKAILIPTPGQTEQEYLAKYLKEKNIFYSVNQINFDINKARAEQKKFKYASLDFDKSFLNAVLIH